MTGNRSLDEFAGSTGEVDGDGPADVDDGPADAGDGSAESAADVGSEPATGGGARDAVSGADGAAVGVEGEEAAVEPVASTYAWSPDGGECGACGTTVEERWRDGERLVCLDCKEW